MSGVGTTRSKGRVDMILGVRRIRETTPEMDSKKSSSDRVNNSDFVRNLPSGMSAADVVKAAKHVHTIR